MPVTVIVANGVGRHQVTTNPSITEWFREQYRRDEYLCFVVILYSFGLLCAYVYWGLAFTLLKVGGESCDWFKVEGTIMGTNPIYDPIWWCAIVGTLLLLCNMRKLSRPLTHDVMIRVPVRPILVKLAHGIPDATVVTHLPACA
jgi:hypothetical protein